MNDRPDAARSDPRRSFGDQPSAGRSPDALPWVRRSPGAPCFETDEGRSWTPIGHNEAIDWVNLAPLFRRRDHPAVDRHFAFLRASGVTCLRVMLEYAQGRHRYFERPAGTVVPAMVRLWDDLFALCERHGLRLLLTPFDTFWMRRRWAHHPYNRERGGPLASLSQLASSPEARRAIKKRLTFVIERWGGSGALFGWDLLNEIHPDLADGRADAAAEFVSDVSSHVRAAETARYGRSHLQTASIFGPDLDGIYGEALGALAFQRPDLDFATSHFYAPRSIDAPRDTVEPAVAVGRLVRQALGMMRDARPFFDSESGPIHTFNKRRKTLPAAFDEEYFRHMQWAHLASGGAGGGMRWPYRNPHRLTDGMHAAQAELARFAALIDWRGFRRKAFDDAWNAIDSRIAAFGCGDENQAVVWLLRRDVVHPSGMLDAKAAPIDAAFKVPGLAPGRYAITAWDTKAGRVDDRVAPSRGGALPIRTPFFRHDLAFAIRRLNEPAN